MVPDGSNEPGMRPSHCVSEGKISGSGKDLRVTIARGAPFVGCPSCKTLVRVRADQIRRKPVVLTQ